QPNFRFHTWAMALVMGISAWLRISAQEFIILLFTIMLVLVAEMLNTAIEAMTDLLTQKKSPYAKISKDVAAGMVLLTALLSLVVGGIILLPYVFKRFGL